MSKMITTGRVTEHWNAAFTRVLKYSVEISHKGLAEHKLITAPEIDILENKVSMQKEKWNAKWDKVEKQNKMKQAKEKNIQTAEELTKKAEDDVFAVENILLETMTIDDTIDWEKLKKKEKYSIDKPSKPIKNEYDTIPDQPNKDSEKYKPEINFIDKIFKSKRLKKENTCVQNYEKDLKEWEMKKKKIEKLNKSIDERYQKAVLEWEKDILEWENNKNEFINKQDTFNAKIDALKNRYFEKDVSAINEYCEMVLNNSKYPENFPNNFEMEYNPENQMLIIEYQLPSPENMPNIKEVKYIATKNELKEVLLSNTTLNKMYDDTLYKMALRTLHELYEADAANAIDIISLNGWVESINKATGKKDNKCILSVQVNKKEFMEIVLENVDPKICFKQLKGVASSKLNSLTPIQPILQLSKDDRRFIDGYNVADALDDGTNIAAMDWGDFEHLIRELFEKEFSVNGGEVKVTQASRDGGVDAVAFDPDPLRGGKIVIQAKRYTNTVGVSAVRDLYGTVVNEGATKGILVSTADYGPDAYDFAKGKPLTLLNGSNLLHLLEKHGHHVKIDLKEAKKIIAENKND